MIGVAHLGRETAPVSERGRSVYRLRRSAPSSATDNSFGSMVMLR
jgi:hypothetical protein